MSNWYKPLYKIANALAKSLGLTPQSELFSLIQKYEKNLKSDGSWQKIVNTRKKAGQEMALQLLQETLSGYEQGRVNDPLLQDPKVKYLGKSKTGGDWYHLPPLPEKTVRAAQGGDKEAQKIVEQYKASLNALGCGGKWCISQPGVYTDQKANNSRGFLFLRRDDAPRVSIPYFHPIGNRDKMVVEEVRGIKNRRENISELDWEDLKSNPMFSFADLEKALEKQPEELGWHENDDEDWEDEEDPEAAAQDELDLMLVTRREIQENPDKAAQAEALLNEKLNNIINYYIMGDTYYSLMSISVLNKELKERDAQIAYNIIMPAVKQRFFEVFPKHQIMMEVGIHDSYSEEIGDHHLFPGLILSEQEVGEAVNNFLKENYTIEDLKEVLSLVNKEQLDLYGWNLYANRIEDWEEIFGRGVKELVYSHIGSYELKPEDLWNRDFSHYDLDTLNLTPDKVDELIWGGLEMFKSQYHRIEQIKNFITFIESIFGWASNIDMPVKEKAYKAQVLSMLAGIIYDHVYELHPLGGTNENPKQWAISFYNHVKELIPHHSIPQEVVNAMMAHPKFIEVAKKTQGPDEGQIQAKSNGWYK